MEELRDLARGDLIGDFIENPPPLLSLENVSGVSLRIDEYWLHWFYSQMYPEHLGSSEIINGRHTRMFYGKRYDFCQKPPDWSEHCQRKGYSNDAHPVAVIVILRKPMDCDSFADPPQWIGPHPIIYEDRPEAIGYNLQSGHFIGSSSEGTLGGFLWHSKDLTFIAVSCAHVLGKGNKRVYSPKPSGSGKKVEIGTIVNSYFPPSSPGVKCNNRIQPNSPNIDVALVELDAGTSVNLPIPKAGKISRITRIADMGQSDPVLFCGFESGTVNAKIKECNIWKEIKINNSPVCFGDLFVLEDNVFNYVATALAKQGDSGAWIVNSDTGVTSWDGMLIGGDGSNVYCCYAENIMNKMNKNVIIAP